MTLDLTTGLASVCLGNPDTVPDFLSWFVVECAFFKYTVIISDHIIRNTKQFTET